MWVGSNTYSMAEEGTTGIQAIDRTFGIVEAMIELEGAGGRNWQITSIFRKAPFTITC